MLEYNLEPVGHEKDLIARLADKRNRVPKKDADGKEWQAGKAAGWEQRCDGEGACASITRDCLFH